VAERARDNRRRRAGGEAGLAALLGGRRQAQQDGRLTLAEANPNLSVIQALNMLITPRGVELPEEVSELVKIAESEIQQPSYLALKLLNAIVGQNQLTVMTPVRNSDDIMSLVLTLKKIGAEHAKELVDTMFREIISEINRIGDAGVEAEKEKIAKKLYNAVRTTIMLALAIPSVYQISVGNLATANAEARLNRPKLLEVVLYGRETIRSPS